MSPDEGKPLMLTDPNDPRHGTITGYGHHGCRCDPCKGANRAATRTARDRRQQKIPDHVHGTENGYSNYRCHCDRCKAAHTADMRRKRGA